MNIFDFIRERKNNNNNVDVPQINAVVESDNPLVAGQVGNAYDRSGLYNRIRNLKNEINLFDKYANPTNETQSVTTDEEGNTVLNMNAGSPVISKRGFLNDVIRGAKENYNTPLSMENWKQKTDNDNMPKNFANRLGEFAGSIGRFAQTPFGRGLITAGLVGATGGDGLQAMTFGTHASALNQKYKNNDALYRNALNDMGIDTNNINGYIGEKEFTNIANNNYKQNSLLIKQQIAGQTDNTRRANMIITALNNGMLSPKEAQQIMATYGISINDLEKSNNTKLLPDKQYALRNGIAIGYGNLGVNQGNLGVHLGQLDLARDKFNAEQNNQETKAPDKKQLLTDPTIRANLAEYKKTRNYKDRQAQTEWFLLNTGYTPEYLMGET